MSRLAAFAGSIVDRIKINTLHREVRPDGPVWIKRRRSGARPVMALANGFFALVQNPVQTLHQAAAWQGWEVACFSHLHGGTYHGVSPRGRRGGSG